MVRGIQSYRVFDDRQVDAMGVVYNQVCTTAREDRANSQIPELEFRSRVAMAVIEAAVTNECDVPTLTRLTLEKLVGGVDAVAER